MYTHQEYLRLRSKYGSYASWAIWDRHNEKDVSIIENHIEQLHSNVIFLALNISSPLRSEPWINFHGGKHDRKIKYVCTNNRLSGAYITDLFKGIAERESTKLKDLLTNELIQQNVRRFHQEMQDVRIDHETQFVVFGAKHSEIARYFIEHFKRNYTNRVIYHYHYSYYGMSDRDWVKSLWDKLDIVQDAESTIKQYNK
jgi:hypothetical protein